MAAEVGGNVPYLEPLLPFLLLEHEASVCQSNIHLCLQSVLTGYLEHLREGEGVDQGVEGLHRREGGGVIGGQLYGCDLAIQREMERAKG
jgi:hypothetical protein